MKLNFVTVTAAALTVATMAANASAQDDRGRYRNPGSVAGRNSGDSNRGQATERAQTRGAIRRAVPAIKKASKDVDPLWYGQ